MTAWTPCWAYAARSCVPNATLHQVLEGALTCMCLVLMLSRFASEFHTETSRSCSWLRLIPWKQGSCAFSKWCTPLRQFQHACSSSMWVQTPGKQGLGVVALVCTYICRWMHAQNGLSMCADTWSVRLGQCACYSAIPEELRWAETMWAKCPRNIIRLRQILRDFGYQTFAWNRIP